MKARSLAATPAALRTLQHHFKYLSEIIGMIEVLSQNTPPADEQFNALEGEFPRQVNF